MATSALRAGVRVGKMSPMGDKLSADESVLAGTVLYEWLQRIEAKQDRILAALETIEQRHGARDQADERLPVALAEVLRGRPFTSVNAWALASADEGLQAALTACDVTTVRELGKLFARLEGRVYHGVRLVRIGVRHRDGIVWQVQVCED